MTATFESFGIKFLYPENWMQVERSEDEGESGITLELPSGGFFSVEKVTEASNGDELIDEIVQTLESEYEEIEHDSIRFDDAAVDEKAVDLRFYYLDLLIVSRIILLRSAAGLVVVQIQAESRDFDENELVFQAILKQLRE